MSILFHAGYIKGFRNKSMQREEVQMVTARRLLVMFDSTVEFYKITTLSSYRMVMKDDTTGRIPSAFILFVRTLTSEIKHGE